MVLEGLIGALVVIQALRLVREFYSLNRETSSFSITKKKPSKIAVVNIDTNIDNMSMLGIDTVTASNISSEELIIKDNKSNLQKLKELRG